MPAPELERRVEALGDLPFVAVVRGKGQSERGGESYRLGVLVTEVGGACHEGIGRLARPDRRGPEQTRVAKPRWVGGDGRAFAMLVGWGTERLDFSEAALADDESEPEHGDNLLSGKIVAARIELQAATVVKLDLEEVVVEGASLHPVRLEVFGEIAFANQILLERQEREAEIAFGQLSRWLRSSCAPR